MMTWILLCGLAAAQTTTATIPASPAVEPPSEGLETVSIEEAVRRVLTRNPSMTSAIADLRRAEALVREARAASLPALSANAAYTHLDAERSQGGTIVAGQNQLGANLQLTVPLFAASSWTSWAHAADLRDVSQANADEIRRQLALATARAYLSVIAQHHILQVASRARENAEAHYAYAHTRFKGGIGHSLDEIRAAKELATDEGQLETARVALLRAQEALGVLVTAAHPVDAAEAFSLPDAPDQREAMESARGTRSDVHASDLRLQAAQRQLRDVWSYFVPNLVAAFQPFYQEPPTTLLPHTGWQAQLLMSLPLYDGGLRYGIRDEREANVLDAEARLEGTVRQAESEVRMAFEAVRRSDLALKDALRAAALASQALDLANLAYKAGAATNIEVIDAERQARDAETQAAIAEDEARQSRLDLLVASGKFPESP